jgi:serine/threonine protein kinase
MASVTTESDSECPKCHAILAHNARHCIACLLRLGCDFADDDSDDFDFDAAWPEAAGDAAPDSSPQITNYRLSREIGEGGFAVVYAAEQLHPVRRDVAVKVIKPGMDTRGVIARFASERQALAVMDHSGIARIFDAGATESGHAFFAMELVPGPPLTEFCDREKLGIRERVEIFIQVCHAVQHAHQKGIIHRDLKPSNVLVAAHDGQPVPKVIDFGIAKATGELRLGDRTIFTAFEPFIGTPAYMSPEQADFGGIDIDTRSDIYSLGVILYELLTGAPPFEQLSHTALDEMRRKIREDRPPRPSARIAALPEPAQKSVAANRSADPAKLIRTLRGDLDIVTMKALEKDRVQRYASAAGLAADLRRWLDREPVSASPPSTFYLLRKFAGRNKTAVIAAAVILLAITAAAVVSTIEAVRARRAEQRALVEAQKSHATAAFLEDAFQSVNPDHAKGQDTALLREILDRADSAIKTGLMQSPEEEAHLRKVIGWTYYKIGDFGKAEANLTEAVRIARGIPGDEIDLCSALDWLTYTEMSFDRDKAETDAREAYSIQTKLAATLDHHSQDARDLAGYGLALSKWLISNHQYDEGVAMQRKWLAFQEDVLGDNDPAIANTLMGLGEVEEKTNHLPEAEQYYRRVLAIRRQNGGEEQLSVVAVLGYLAAVRRLQGDMAGHDAFVREADALNKKLLPPAHPDFVPSLVDLAAVLKQQGHLDRAQMILLEAIAVGPNPSATTTIRELVQSGKSLAAALEEKGEKPKADELLQAISQIKLTSTSAQ